MTTDHESSKLAHKLETSEASTWEENNVDQTHNDLKYEFDKWDSQDFKNRIEHICNVATLSPLFPIMNVKGVVDQPRKLVYSKASQRRTLLCANLRASSTVLDVLLVLNPQ